MKLTSNPIVIELTICFVGIFYSNRLIEKYNNLMSQIFLKNSLFLDH